MLFILASVFVAVFTATAEDSSSPLEACPESRFFDEEADLQEDEVFEVSLLQTGFSLAAASTSKTQKATTNILHRKENEAAATPQHEKQEDSAAQKTVSQKQPESSNAVQEREDLKVEGGDGYAARNLVAESKLRRLLGIVFDDAHFVEQTHKTLLVVICCMGLTIMIAVHYHTTHKASNKLVDCLTNMPCDQQTWHLALGPSACLKVPLEYKLDPDDCPHEEGLRTYKARHNTFQICDQCGSRWMFQKEKGAYTPIAPRAHPADPE